MWSKIKSVLLRNKDTRQTVAKNTFWLTVSNIGGRLIRAAIIIYAARILGAAGWGVFSYAITLAAFLTIFTDLGIGHILLREIVKTSDPTHKTRLISTTFFLKIFFLAIGTFIIVFLAPRLTSIPEARPILPIVALIFIFDSLREFGFSLIRAREKMEWETAIFLSMNVAIVVLGFIFMAISPTVLAFTYSYAMGSGFGLIATVFLLRRFLTGLLSNFSKNLVGYILAAAWPFALSGLLAALMVNTDVLIIGWFRSATEVGLYSAPLRIIQLLYILPSILAVSALPTFTRLADKNLPKMREALEQVVSFSFLVAIPIAVGGFMVASQLVHLLFGTEYMPGTLPFQILLLTLIVDFPAVILSNAVFAHNKQKLLVLYAAIGGGLNVILDLLFIPSWGIVGSAWATLLAQLVSNWYLWRVTKNLDQFRVLPRLNKVIAATAVMAVAVTGFITLEAPVWITISAAGFVYLGTLYILREPFLRYALLLFRGGPSGPETAPIIDTLS